MRAQSSVGTAEWTTLIEAINIGGGELRKRPRIRSGGLPYRAANATALIGEPDLNILNDPLSAQDPMPVAARMDLPACSLDRRQAAKMLITHDLGPAARRLATGMVCKTLGSWSGGRRPGSWSSRKPLWPALWLSIAIGW